jgi:hypothetical protein
MSMHMDGHGSRIRTPRRPNLVLALYDFVRAQLNETHALGHGGEKEAVVRRMAIIASAALLVGILAYALRATSSAPHARNPLTTLVRDSEQVGPLQGRVEQRLPVGGYTYLALRRADDSVLWVVTLGRGAGLGEQVAVRSMGRRTDFYSRRLQRTFPLLVFGIVSGEH